MPLNLAYSYSRMKAFECPFRFREIYLNKRLEPTSGPAFVGKITHDIMAKYIKRLYETSQQSDLNALITIYEKTKGTLTIPIEIEGQREGVLNSIEGIVQGLHAREWAIDPEVDGYWIEQQMAFDSNWDKLGDKAWFDNKSGRVYFRAILDWAYLKNGELVIIDHKSGWSEPDKDQLPIYAWTALRGLCPHDNPPAKVTVKFNFLSRGGDVQEIQSYTPEEVETFGPQVDGWISSIEENEDWDPIPGPYCSYCGFKAECPKMNEAWDHVKAIAPSTKLEITTQEQAEQGLELFVLVKERLSELEKLLKEWVVITGDPIFAAGKVMERRKKTTWENVNTWKLLKALEDIGIPPADVAATQGISKTGLQKILKSSGKTRYSQDLLETYGDLMDIVGDPSIYVNKQ